MMAGKAGGRLTFSGRQEYEVVPLYFTAGPLTKSTLAYAAMCRCGMGNHYLAPDGEHTVSHDTQAYIYATYADAQAAIEQWQRQHAAAQANSGESEA